MKSKNLVNRIFKYKYYILIFLFVFCSGFSYILGFTQGKIATNNTSDIAEMDDSNNPTEENKPVRKSISGTVTEIDSDNFKIEFEEEEIIIRTSENTKYSGTTIEVGKNVILTVLQDGSFYTAEKVRVLIPAE